MNQLTLFEQGLVPVYKTDQGEHVVNGRELWEGLEAKTDFSTWIKRRLTECDAAENEEYTSLPIFEEREIGATKRIEYIIKLDTAKEMAMLERNEIGKRVRKYFIAVEKKSKQVPQLQQLTPELQMIKGLFDSVVSEREARLKQDAEIQKIKEDVQLVKEQITSKPEMKIAPVQTELSIEADIYSKTMLKDRISTEQVASMYCVSSRVFYGTLHKLGLVVPSVPNGWELSSDYEGKGIGFTGSRGRGYAYITWTQRGVKLIKEFLKDNGVTPMKRLPQKRKVKARKTLV